SGCMCCLGTASRRSSLRKHGDLAACSTGTVRQPASYPESYSWIMRYFTITICVYLKALLEEKQGSDFVRSLPNDVVQEIFFEFFTLFLFGIDLST
ncbi:4443_t:CDS:2, partial [Gigaspora rosea]